MSLRRQLVLVISALFLLVFAGTVAISVNHTRVYLEEQMQSHAQDTATSLALSIGPAVERGDWPTVNSMADAIFDRGYYRELVFLSTDGKVLLKRDLPVKVEGVPHWFVRMIPLDTPKGEALVAAGWKQAGRLIIRSHPGYAYNELWRSTTGTLEWFVASWVGAVVLVFIVLKYALAPLGAVEKQALAISDREFPVLEKLPWTRELRSVVAAMNKMSEKVKRFIAEQMDLTEKIREEAHRDQVTGLANRRFFDARLKYLLKNPDEFPRGALILVELDEFKEYNDRNGLEKGDELLRQAAVLIQRVAASNSETLVARLTGADFAVLARVASPEEALGVGERLCSELTLLRTGGLTDSLSVGHAGVAYHDRERTTADIFSEADMALRAAQRKGPNACHIYDVSLPDIMEVHGATRWHEIIGRAIESREVKLTFQAVVTCDAKAPMHYEALARIRGEKGELLPAGLFMPMAERLGMAPDFDRVVVGKAFDHLASIEDKQAVVAVNISPASVHDAAFADWLCALLKARGDGLARRVIFEATEYGCAAKPASLGRFVERVRSCGAQFSLDHFGVGLSSFGYMRDLKLDYIKIDGSIIRHIHTNRDNQFFVHSITGIAHGLDMRVIAESVEEEQELETLKALRIDGVQGYLVGEPKDMS